jgi:hypothetical protein
MMKAKVTTELVQEDGENRVRIEVTAQAGEGRAVSLRADADGLVDLDVVRNGLRMLLQEIEG